MARGGETGGEGRRGAGLPTYAAELEQGAGGRLASGSSRSSSLLAGEVGRGPMRGAGLGGRGGTSTIGHQSSLSTEVEAIHLNEAQRLRVCVYVEVKDTPC